ncbi:MAG: glycosyltransferase [Sphingobacteriia bacterium]|nr:glycosyltransferase [Sphingobacteriia bacterium]NCC41173.1 glycosyltransferase [Gammaproteobacteria bacterium]
MAVKGGAERLTCTLLDHLPGTDLCTGFVDPERFPSLGRAGGRVFDLHAASRLPLWRILRVIRAFEHGVPDLDRYDWALFSGIYAPLAVARRSRHPNLLYCHTIPRFCFDLREHYMRKLPWIARPALALLIAVVARKYARALARMDLVVANSENVRKRLLRHFGRTSILIHPPVDTQQFRWIADGQDYVSLARLEDFKRVDVIVRAFLRMPQHRLVVASGGHELERLRRLAAGARNIQFTGWLSEAALRDLVGRARAAIYVPIDEDFGMSPVEAMAAGKPVIGVAEGGLLETIIPGRTGILIDSPPTPEAICEAVERLERDHPPSLRAACEERAALFDERIFVTAMRDLLERSTRV